MKLRPLLALALAVSSTVMAAPVSKVLKTTTDVAIPAGKKLVLYNFGSTSATTTPDGLGWLVYVVPDPANAKSEKLFTPEWLSTGGAAYGPVKIRFRPGKDILGNTTWVYVLYDIVNA